MKIRDEKGVAMVEATLYMPLVLCVVMSLLYLALFNMQEYMMLYEAQRVAAVAAREDAYIGYDTFGMGTDHEIDFVSGADLTSDGKVNGYLEAHHKKLSTLYRGAGKLVAAITGGHAGAQAVSVAATVRESTLVALGTMSVPEIDVNTGFLGTNVTVTITHKMPMPGVMAYLGYDGSTTLKASAYTFSINPSEFVRNVDLGGDLADYICDKLGINLGEFVGETKKVLGKIKIV